VGDRREDMRERRKRRKGSVCIGTCTGTGAHVVLLTLMVGGKRDSSFGSGGVVVHDGSLILRRWRRRPSGVDRDVCGSNVVRSR